LSERFVEEGSPVRLLPVAALQTAPVAWDPPATAARFADHVRAVRDTFPRTRLVLAPELHLMAVGHPLDEHAGYHKEVAIDLDGPLCAELGRLARETRLWLVPGTVFERGEAGAVHNTALVFAPDGELVTRYRKCFPWQPYETTTPGRQLVTFDVPDVGRIGLAICHDGAFPEVFRQLAWFGAEAVLQPVLTPTSDRPQELVLARANAIANQMYVVSLNAAAPTGTGRSVVVDPEGHVRYEAGATEEVVTDVLDLDAVRRVREYGTAGLNRLLDQLDRIGPDLELPAYGGYRPRPARTEGNPTGPAHR
jgi:formamidase